MIFSDRMEQGGISPLAPEYRGEGTGCVMTQRRRPTSADTEQERPLRADVSKSESLLLRKEEVLQDLESRKRNLRKTKTKEENEGRKFRELLQKKKQKKRSGN